MASSLPTSFHAAPWSRTLMGISVLGTGFILAVGFLLAARGEPSGRLATWALVLLVAGALLFVVRGYQVRPGVILVRRLLWTTRLPLAGLRSIEADPEAMRGAIRVFGNGGLFSFTGRYRSPKLGGFRAYVTDPARAVVLRFDDRVFVVSPGVPEAFVREVESARGA